MCLRILPEDKRQQTGVRNERHGDGGVWVFLMLGDGGGSGGSDESFDEPDESLLRDVFADDDREWRERVARLRVRVRQESLPRMTEVWAKAGSLRCLWLLMNRRLCPAAFFTPSAAASRVSFRTHAAANSRKITPTWAKAAANSCVFGKRLCRW